MKIVIEGTPEECADAIRRLAAPQDIKPTFAHPHVPQSPTPWLPYVGDYPLPTDRIGPIWQIDFAGTQIATDGTQFTYAYNDPGVRSH